MSFVSPQHFWVCLVCVTCNSKSFHSFIFKLCIMIVQTLKMCTSYSVHISWIFPHFCRVVTLHLYPSATLLGCLVCVICNSKSSIPFSFYSNFVFIIVHTLKMCTSYFVHISWIFPHFCRVVTLHLYPSATLLGCLVCVICNSKSSIPFSFYSNFVFIIVHTLKLCTSYFVNISWIFPHFCRVVTLHFYPSATLLGCVVCVRAIPEKNT